MTTCPLFVSSMIPTITKWTTLGFAGELGDNHHLENKKFQTLTYVFDSLPGEREHI